MIFVVLVGDYFYGDMRFHSMHNDEIPRSGCSNTPPVDKQWSTMNITNIQFKIHSKPPNSVQHHHLQRCFTHDGKSKFKQQG